MITQFQAQVDLHNGIPRLSRPRLLSGMNQGFLDFHEALAE